MITDIIEAAKWPTNVVPGRTLSLIFIPGGKFCTFLFSVNHLTTERLAIYSCNIIHIRFDNIKNIEHLNAKVTEWAAEYVRAIDVADLLVKPDILGNLASVWDKFNDNQLTQLKSLSSPLWDTLITRIPVEDLVALSPELQNTLDIGEKIVERLKSVTRADVSKWGNKQWSRVPIDNLASMRWSVLKQVPVTELEKWTEVLFIFFFFLSCLFCCFISIDFGCFLLSPTGTAMQYSAPRAPLRREHRPKDTAYALLHTLSHVVFNRICRINGSSSLLFGTN